MKLLRCLVKNFGSYKVLSFDFSGQGLALIYGPTGSGKSTVCDIAPWILYGQTAKDGAVDEVRSWQATEATYGEIEVSTPKGTLIVVRIRGAKPSENDLFWYEEVDEIPQRGKDLTDTQKLLNERLGVSPYLYLTAAYFSEFSATGGFFTSKAKDRRAIFESIASLTLPITLAERTSNAKKEVKKEIHSLDNFYSEAMGRLSQFDTTENDIRLRMDGWTQASQRLSYEITERHRNFEEEKQKKIKEISKQIEDYEEEKSTRIDKLICDADALNKVIVLRESFDSQIAYVKAEIDRATALCDKCGSNGSISEDLWTRRKEILKAQATNDRNIDSRDYLVRDIKAAQAAQNPFLSQLKQAQDATNHYEERLEELKTQVNPFYPQLTKLAEDKGVVTLKLNQLKSEIADLTHKSSALDRLYDLSFTLRGEMLKKSVKDIEASTNRYLETYFDSEIRVGFSLEADSLKVDIQKSGYPCTYRQLSKGQRGILRLCFTVTIMQAAANKAGTFFSTLCFDEALDGLDSDLKVKAFGLFEELSKSHDSILVIDHSQEFKELFTKRYKVSLESDESTLEMVY